MAENQDVTENDSIIVDFWIAAHESIEQASFLWGHLLLHAIVLLPTLPQARS
jgi:hypothetical protein